MARQKKKFQVFTLRLEELVLVEFQTCVYYLVSQICYNLIFLFLLLNLVEKKERMRESSMLIMSLQGGKESLPRQRKNNKEKRGFSN